MSSPRTSLLVDLLILTITITGLSFLIHQNELSAPTEHISTATTSQMSAGAAAISTSTPTAAATTTPAKTASAPKLVAAAPASPKISTSTEPAVPQVQRIENPYPYAPSSLSDTNTLARAALVNIFCYPHGGSLRPISGSGVIIDSRGVILTNAHVAQYVLLSQDPSINLECYVRTGSPAVSRWIPKVLYIPPVWVRAHAQDINADHATGTGEHDYALLSISSSIDNTPLPVFPHLEPDTREAISFVGDEVLVASYPAEFAGGNTQFSLYSASSYTEVAKFLTFATSSVDVMSVGSVIEAQGGSSGGAIVNPWNKLVGIITTTSEGATTGDRDLRGITLSYINRDLIAQTGKSLSQYLLGDIGMATDAFDMTQGKTLTRLYLDILTH